MKTRRVLTILLAILLVAVVAAMLFACKDKTKPNEDTPSNNTGNTDTPGGNTDTPGGNTDPSGGNTTPGGNTDVDTSISVPTGLAVSGSKASWKRVTGANFELEVNGTVINVGNAINYDLLNMTNPPADGKFTLRVRATKDGKASAWSEAVTFTYVAVQVVNPTVTGLTGTTMTWTASSNALYPLVTVGTTEYKLAADATSYDLASVAAKSDVTLTYVADGVYYKNSATVRLAYDPATATLAYAAPAKAYMVGEVLRFDKVEGANAYYFQDVQGRITALTGEEINDLANDRFAHLLIKQMWAGNTDLDIADSAPVEITYFEGDESDPFLVKDVSDLRYIEYYEAVAQTTGVVYHYKLAADVTFEDYTPKNDEEYSNFYNLGSFSGVLDGDDHSLKNVVVYYKDGYSSIFDNITETGVIRNINIENTKWRTWTNRTNDGIMHEKGGEVAVLAYTNRGTIEGVNLMSGAITAAKDGAAGLVSINRGVIRNCTVCEAVTVTGVNEVGAVAIYNAGTIEGCVNHATVKGSMSVGGIVGRNAGLVTKCGNDGAVSGDNTVGGLVGYNYNVKDVDGGMQYDTMVSLSYNKGTVTAFRNAGGLVGRNGSTGANELGGNRMSESYANAGVFGCYNQGDVSGAFSAGGLIGENRAYNETGEGYRFGVFGCYSSGDVQAVDCNVLYFVNTKGWGAVYAYAWNDEIKTNDGAWPGNQCVEVGTNEYGQAICAVVVSSACDMVIFNDGGDNKTADIAFTTLRNGFYLNDDGSYGNYAYDGSHGRYNMTLGYLTGYNNAVSDCYYAVWTECSYVTVGGTETSVEQLSVTTDRQAMTTKLNAAVGATAFATTDGYPVLAWELQD